MMSSAAADDLLLELMDEFQPHLQSHRHKLQTWRRLLREFNRRTGGSIRQERTLRMRFERMKETLESGGEVHVLQPGLLETLVREYNGSRGGNRRVEVGEHEWNGCQPAGFEPLGSDLTSGTNSADEREESEPPPLDTMDVFPATEMRLLVERERYNLLRQSLVSFDDCSPEAGLSGGSSYCGSTSSHTSLLTPALSMKGVCTDGLHEVGRQLQSQAVLDIICGELQQLRQQQETLEQHIFERLDRLAALLAQKPENAGVRGH
ncbi:ADL178Wp [Eremothecium gossypii ATCC 10895]|uniref:ADL178Wp n=1 Tax=Eremothecium gossypii (strain ATCC 10895 / CBS 109.51 / FGSC 9923 / NRRL Y-1056) TaxID=284811 RepID=Q75AU8_EREGS|nr:ADL178Wp [Eremothecium gossypii ATCC 10895]AAS51742.1 ADL178Wp [Eremothecium gossypii ATCC 10895]AEY96039.1 FADL178Wp [Eremothecium gossypii FDAG1]